MQQQESAPLNPGSKEFGELPLSGASSPLRYKNPLGPSPKFQIITSRTGCDPVRMGPIPSRNNNHRPPTRGIRKGGPDQTITQKSYVTFFQILLFGSPLRGTVKQLLRRSCLGTCNYYVARDEGIIGWSSNHFNNHHFEMLFEANIIINNDNNNDNNKYHTYIDTNNYILERD